MIIKYKQNLVWYAPLIAAIAHMGILVGVRLCHGWFTPQEQLIYFEIYPKLLLGIVFISYLYIIIVHRYSRFVKKIIHCFLGGISLILIGWSSSYVDSFWLSLLFMFMMSSYPIMLFGILIAYDGKEV